MVMVGEVCYMSEEGVGSMNWQILSIISNPSKAIKSERRMGVNKCERR